MAGVIARTAAEAGRRVCVFKPAVSGLDEIAAEGGVPDHEHLRRAARSEQADEDVAPYRYGPAVSPHLAAEMAGEEIHPARLDEAVARSRGTGDFLVCEGVGGFLVPLRLDYLVRDLAVDIGLPVVVVAAPGLGTINHTLLTTQAVQAAGLEVASVVLNPWPPEPSRMERSNLAAIEELGGVTVQTVGPLDPADPATWPDLLP